MSDGNGPPPTRPELFRPGVMPSDSDDMFDRLPDEIKRIVASARDYPRVMKKMTDMAADYYNVFFSSTPGGRAEIEGWRNLTKREIWDNVKEAAEGTTFKQTYQGPYRTHLGKNYKALKKPSKTNMKTLLDGFLAYRDTQEQEWLEKFKKLDPIGYATTITSRWRGNKQRELYRQEKADATQVQSLVRGNKQRKLY